MSTKIFAAMFLVLMVFPCNAFAGGFCCQVSTGSQEGFMSAGNVSLGLDESYSRMTRFQKGGDWVSLSSVEKDPRFAKKGGVVPLTMDMNRITLTGSYAPTDRLRINVAVPWVINDMTMAMYMPAMMGMSGMPDTPASWESMTMDEISDLGDVTLVGTYRVYQDKDDHPTTSLSLGAGVKFPTGSSTYASSSGRKIHAHMQPGTGSWDPILVASFSKMLGSSFLVQANARYQIATANGLGYSFGDTASVGAALNYNLADFVNVSLGVDYFHSEQADDPDNKYNGHNSARLTDFTGYTGEDSVWVSPGLHVMPFKGASVDLKFQYPLYYHVPDIEQVTDYRLTAGLSYSF